VANQLQAVPVWVVLPDRYQVASFRRRLAEAGGALGIHVGTFGDLFHELFIQAGMPIPLAPEPVIERLLRSAIDELLAADQLPYYANIAHTPGFLASVRDRIAELKRNLILPESFLSQVESRSPGLIEIGRIYQVYQGMMTRLDWADPDGLNWLATAALEANPALAAGWELVIVDGFDNFYPSQLATLRLLGVRLPELLITLPGDPERDRTAHRRFQRTLKVLSAGLPDAVVESLPDPRLSKGSLAHIERSLFEIDVEVDTPAEGLTRLELRSPGEEAREALRWIKAQHVRRKISLEACAIIAPQPETYRPLLREAAAEFGLPLRFTHGEPLTSAPAIDSLLDLLDLVRRDWPRRLTIDALRSPYFDLRAFGLERQDATALEDVSQFGQVVEGLEIWMEALQRLREATEDETDLEEDLRLPHLPRGRDAGRLLAGVTALAERILPPQSLTTTGWVEWLEDLLDDLQTFEQAETPRDAASLIGLRERLRALVLGENVAAGGEVGYTRFLTELRSALESGTYMDEGDRRQPAVLVLRVLEARGLRFDCVAILGLSEGQFPEVEREDPFLPEDVRRDLGLEPRLNREQGGLFYQAVTRADQLLLLTRPYLAADGERWERSPFWMAVERIFTGSATRIQPEAPRALPDAASAQELLFWAVRKRGLPKNYKDSLGERWSTLQSAHDVLSAREDLVDNSPFEGAASDLRPQLQDRYGADHIWSSSRLEAYGTCPFDFFIGTALGLERRQIPEPGLDAAQLGSMLHAVLEEVYQGADDPADLQAVLKALPDIARRAFDDAPEEYGFRPTPLWELEKAGWLQALEETIVAIAHEEPGWIPVGFEQVFGIKGAPPLDLDLGKERISVRGFIDRIDRNNRGKPG
jgi:ATP-dependent helicase/DNAse subunit B